jgi:hypothetical protein
VAANVGDRNDPLKESPPPGSTSAGPDLPWDPPAGSLPVPSADVPLNFSAEKIFPRAAKTGRLFVKDKIVVEVVDRNGRNELEPVTPVRFRSWAEQLGPLVIYRRYKNGGCSWRPALLREENAAALLETDAARELPQISVILRCPAIATDAGTPLILGPGFHPYFGGMLIGGEMPLDPPFDESVEKIRDIFSGFLFTSDGDYARGIASLFTPALVATNLIQGRAPIEVAESNAPGAGKGYRQKIIAATYNDKCRDAAKKRGVGGIEESVGGRFLAGCRFVRIDNTRGRIDSQWIESFADSDDIGVRLPFRQEAFIDPTRHLLYISSNGLQTTPDLAERAVIIRTLAQDARRYKTYPEGELLEHVRANQPYILGCVYAVLKRWIADRRRSYTDTPHRYHAWASAADYIVSEYFGTVRLMEGHDEIQKRATDSALTATRELCLAAAQATTKPPAGDDWLFTADLVGIAQSNDIFLPGVNPDAPPEDACKQLGTMLGKMFKAANSNEIRLDGFVIKREEVTRKCEETGSTFKSKGYKITPVDPSSAAPQEPRTSA